MSSGKLERLLEMLEAGEYKNQKWVKKTPGIQRQQLTHIQQIISRLYASNCSSIAGNLKRCGEEVEYGMHTTLYFCNSPFCPRCRHKRQKDAAKDALLKFSYVPRDQLRFLTILLPVLYSPDKTDLKQRRDKAKKDIIKALRPLNDVRLFGYFEIDVKDADNLDITSREYKVLSDLGLLPILNARFLNHPYLLHYHAIVDLGQNTVADLRSALQPHFPHNYQINIKQLYAQKLVPDNLQNLAFYMLKFRAQFSTNIYANDDTENKSMTRYRDLYPQQRMSHYVSLVHDVGKFKFFKFHYNVR